MELREKMRELEITGSTRFYENEGFDLYTLMNLIEETLSEEYAYGLEEGTKGLFLEIVRY